jgi:regulation of enolase protein 1 (concanavalin A-like superfamily)
MKFLLVITLLLAANILFSQNNSLGAFTHSADIGRPKNAGSSSYDSATKTYLLKGSGYNIWFNRDEFHYLYSRMKGDFVLTANFQIQGDSGNPHRKFGWMIRESEDAASVSINAVQHGDGLVVLQWRGELGANMRDPEDEIFFPTKKIFQVLQMERKGNMITMKVGNPGEPPQLVGSHELPLPEAVLAGLFICSHDENRIEEVKVWDVKIEKAKKK